MLNIVLLVFLFPESNFIRPESSPQMQELQAAADIKVEEATVAENASDMPPENEYTVHTPALREILRPIHCNPDLNFFWSLLSPLKLLVHPSIVWGILTYGISLSPQIIMMYVSLTL